MKVLFLNKYEPSAKRGGVEMTLDGLVRGLRDTGVEPVVLATDNQRGLRKGQNDGFAVWRAGMNNPYITRTERPRTLDRLAWHTKDTYNLSMQEYLKEVLLRESPDVVSVHNLSGWSAAAWTTIANTRIPIVQVLHDQYLLCPNSNMFKHHRNCGSQCWTCRALRAPHRRLSNRIAAVVGVSKFVLARHLEFGYFEKTRIRRVIHDARDRGLLDLRGTEKISGRRDRLRFGFIGRLGPVKGIERLLSVFSRSCHLNSDLWVAGSGNEEYVAELRRRYASDCVTFLGRVLPSEFFPNVDVVVVPSLWHDTFPGVVIEALAFGKPVIGSRRGGIPEMIRERENGLLIDPDSDQEFSAALRVFVDDVSARRQMSVGALLSARQFLDFTSWVSEFARLYEDVLSENGTVP